MQLSGGADLEFQSPGHRQTGPSCLRRYVMDGIEVLDARGTLTTEEDNREGAVVYECEGNKVVLGLNFGYCPRNTPILRIRPHTSSRRRVGAWPRP